MNGMTCKSLRVGVRLDIAGTVLLVVVVVGEMPVSYASALLMNVLNK